MDVLRDKAVLVSLNVRRWEIRAHDVEASREVARSKGLTDPRLVRLWKARIPENDFVSAINGSAAGARKVHWENSFPWFQEGTRILPTRNYVAYTELMRERKEHFFTQVDKFIAQFHRLKTKAKESLKDLYKEADYPDVEGLRDYFGFEIKVVAVPAGEMFSPQLDPAEIERVREDIENSVQQAFRDANRDLWGRLYSTIRRMQERLNKPKHMREESLTSLREMLQLLDRLNVSGDEQLERLRKQAEDSLSGVTLEDLKENESLRDATLEEALRIEKAMMGFMGEDFPSED